MRTRNNHGQKTRTTRQELRLFGLALLLFGLLTFVSCAGNAPTNPTSVPETLCPQNPTNACTMEYMPVCGKTVLNVGDTVFQTFGNKCTACAAMKVVSYMQGECNASILKRRYKSTDLKTCEVIKYSCGDGSAAFSDNLGCGCEPELPANATVCDHIAARGWMCTTKYDPVCGSNKLTYPSGCQACKDGTVDYYVNGSCEGTPSTETPANYTQCTEPRQQACTREYMPVCAEVDNGIRCIKAPCPSSDLKTYSNKCDACSDPKVYGYTPGECPEQ